MVCFLHNLGNVKTGVLVGSCNIVENLFRLSWLLCVFSLSKKKKKVRPIASCSEGFDSSFLSRSCMHVLLSLPASKALPFHPLSWVTVSLGGTSHQPVYGQQQNASAELLQCPGDADRLGAVGSSPGTPALLLAQLWHWPKQPGA